MFSSLLAGTPGLLLVNNFLRSVKRPHQVAENLLLGRTLLPRALLLQSFQLHLQQLILAFELASHGSRRRGGLL